MFIKTTIEMGLRNIIIHEYEEEILNVVEMRSHLVTYYYQKNES